METTLKSRNDDMLIHAYTPLKSRSSLIMIQSKKYTTTSSNRKCASYRNDTDKLTTVTTCHHSHRIDSWIHHIAPWFGPISTWSSTIFGCTSLIWCHRNRNCLPRTQPAALCRQTWLRHAQRLDGYGNQTCDLTGTHRFELWPKTC